jgi:hypothetical protein
MTYIMIRLKTNAMQFFLTGYEIPVLEISMGDFGAYNDTLVKAIQNGKCEKWKREVFAPTPTMFSEFKNGTARFAMSFNVAAFVFASQSRPSTAA